MTTLPKKRHRLINMQYDEVSLVDKGANQYAHVVIVKRDSTDVSKMRPGGEGPPAKSSSKSPPRKADWYASNRAPGNADGSKRKKGTSERAQNWDGSKHPRVAAGSAGGGTFSQTSSASKAKYGKGGTTAANQKTSTSSTTTKTYTMKKGDTLWALAEEYYGDGTQWKKIAKASGIKDPKKIPIGAKITIPGVKSSAKAKTPAKKTTSTTTPTKTAGQKLVMEPGGRVHWEAIKLLPAEKKANADKKKALAQKRKTLAARKRALAAKKKALIAAKKNQVSKQMTGSEKAVAQIMFERYTGRR